MQRLLEPTGNFSLLSTCGPVEWGRGRWPNQDWLDGTLIWAGWEDDRLVHRRVAQTAPDTALTIRGDANPAWDRDWARRVLGVDRAMPSLTDPVLQAIAAQHPGLRPHMSGSLFDGLVDSIVGQSITVLAAAVVGARIAALFHPGVELAGRIFWPAPRPADLARADVTRLRRTGLTWKRAEALIAAGQAALDGALREPGGESIDDRRAMLRGLPLVGVWTAESALLWGIGEDDAFPMGDIALLRAARRAYDLPEMTMQEMQSLSASWAGHRGWGSRLLWTDLLGPASYQSVPVKSPAPGAY